MLTLIEKYVSYKQKMMLFIANLIVTTNFFICFLYLI
jgi:hypothetical protein